MDEKEVEEVKEVKDQTKTDEVVAKAIEKIQKDTNDIMNSAQVKELLRNNIREFEHQGIKYRIQKPNFDQKYEVSREQSKQYIKMLKDDSYVLESNLIEIYKNRGIDIPALDEKFDNLKKEKEVVELKLGKALEDKLPEADLKVLDKELVNLQEQQQSTMMEKSVLLNDSLESQLNTYSYTYLAYLITEKNSSEDPEKPEWIHPWDSYQEFLKEEESLVNVLIWFTMFMARDEIKVY